MLANGGVTETPGAVLVGENGPEILDLPRGARVSPLGAQTDYDKLSEAVVGAIRTVLPELAINIRIDGNRDRLVDVMIEENQKYVNMTGEGMFA
jgi:succinyl-CoA synthetase beta subunit